MASPLPSEAVAALQDLLAALTSADNAVRSSAEASLNNEWVTKNPDILMVGLSEQMKTNPQDSSRSFAAVLFRRIASKSSPKQPAKTILMTLQPGTRNIIKSNLLTSFKEESKDPVRHKVADAIAEVGRYTVDAKDTWQEMLAVLFQASNSQEEGQRESAYRIFSAVPEIIGSQHGDVVRNVFKQGFEDTSKEVRIVAVGAFTAFYGSVGKAARASLQQLLPDVLNILPPLHTSQDSDGLTKCLGSLIELAEVSAKIFAPFFGTVVEFGISVVKDKELSPMARQTALELLTQFAESSPKMCRREDLYAREMVTQCLSLMTDVSLDDDDAEEWNDADDLDMDESDANHVAGEQAMDRLAVKLGGNVILPPTLAWLPRMISSAEWRERHAALMAISAIAEGCEDIMKAELAKVLDLIIPPLRDPHPRVRWAACNAVGQLSTDFAPVMQTKYHSVILPNLIPVLKSPEPRVQAHAAAALVNFCEEADNLVMEPYLDSLLDNLHHLLQNPKKFVQEQAVTTIATVADAAESKFIKYYDAFMPLLLGVLTQAVDKDYRLLRSKAMECATLIAIAVGKEKFAPDAQAMFTLLGSIQQEVTEADDPQAGYLVQAWGRLCRVLGQEFVPYLGAVVPPLLESAKISPHVTFPDSEDAKQYENEEGWDVVLVKGRHIAIQTSSLEDKCTAVEMLICYASQLQEAFDPYVPTVLNEVVLPSMSFLFHDGVRSAAAKCLPQLLNARKQANPKRLYEIWQPALEKLLNILQQEALIDVIAELYSCLCECLEVMGENSLDAQGLERLVTSTESILQDYIKRGQIRAANHTEEDDEDEDYLAEVEDDADLLADMNKAFHCVFKYHHFSFLPQWTRLQPYLQAFLSQNDSSQRQWALCMIDDVIEFAGRESFQYQDLFLPSLSSAIRDTDYTIRQAGAYGIGVAAQHGGEAYTQFCVSSLPALFAMTQLPQARVEDDVYATENACSAISKILRTKSSHVTDLNGVITAWLGTLPVVNDDEAAPYVYAYLNDLIDKQHPAVHAQIPHVFDAISRVLEAKILTDKSAQMSAQGAKKMMASLSPHEANTIVHSMPPERQQAIASFFQ